jgi:two-component system sensor histidine kinase HydH
VSIPWKEKRLQATVAIYLAIAAVSVLHYSTGAHEHSLHDIYRRLYYLPIILAAFLHGLRGGLLAAAIVCLVYLPHALGYVSHDPATGTQKALEMILYLAVGGTTGVLASRLKGTERVLRSTADELRGSLERLQSTEKQLIRTEKLAAVGRLSAGLAHEIRNPLASIKGSAEILGDDFPEGHPKHKLLQVLVDESVRLNNVLTRFITFARPRPLERSEVEIEREIETVIELLRGQKEGAAVTYRLEREGETGAPDNPGMSDVPRGASTPLVLQGDREQLRQVLLNVLLNATQASGEGGEVAIAVRREGDACSIRVHDSGAGFSPEAIENAFTPFFTTRDEGTGLGLAVSHRIVESHGGRITVENHPQGGGLVELRLPVR